MEITHAIVLGVMIVLWFIAFLKVFYDTKRKGQSTSLTRRLVRIAVFGAISAILYCVPILKFPVPIFPQFLEFHFDEIPAFIAGFAYGPLSAIGVLLVKTLIKLPLTSTLCVGELSDLLFSAAFIIPASLIYKYHRNIKGALVGLGTGLVFQLLFSIIGNIYVMVPFYMFMFNMSSQQLLSICQLANPAIKDVGWTYGLFAVLPFNLIKDVIVIIVTILVYKSTHRFIDKLQA